MRAYQRMIGRLNVDDVTQAPLRQRETLRLNATPETVLNTLLDLHGCESHQIVHWEWPRVYAYRAKCDALRDHLCVFRVQEDGHGASVVSAWQYFNTKRGGGGGGLLAPYFMRRVVTRALGKLARAFGSTN